MPELIKKKGLESGMARVGKKIENSGRDEKSNGRFSNFCFPNFCKIEPRTFREAGTFVNPYFDNPGWQILSKHFIYRKTYCVKDDKVHIDSKLVLAFKSEN